MQTRRRGERHCERLMPVEREHEGSASYRSQVESIHIIHEYNRMRVAHRDTCDLPFLTGDSQWLEDDLAVGIRRPAGTRTHARERERNHKTRVRVC